MLAKKLMLISTLLLSLFTLLGCATTTTTDVLDYDDFDYVDDYNDVFNRSQGTYIVYVYASSCSVCAKIKADVLEFAEGYTDYPIYFFDAGAVDTTYQADYLNTIGQASVQTPTILIIKNNTFDKTNVSRYLFSGESKIRSLMTDLENDAFLYWN